MEEVTEKKDVVEFNKLVLSEPTVELKLDLACGQTPKAGFTGVDLNAPNPDMRVDLFKFPYPWADNSVDEIHCSHFVEHLECRTVEERDLVTQDPVQRKRLLGKDFLFAFFDECYRILKPNAKMLVIVPAGQSARAFQDPTHRRFIVHNTFLYLAREWRALNKLDHYNVECNFGLNVQHTCDAEIGLRAAGYQTTAFQHYWNTMIDLHALLVKQP